MSQARKCDCCGVFAECQRGRTVKLPLGWLKMEWSAWERRDRGCGKYCQGRVELCEDCTFLDPRDGDVSGCPHKKGKGK